MGEQGETVWAQVRARDNSDGSYGPWSYVLYATGNRDADRQVPTAPAAPTVTAGDTQLTVTWTAPADHGYVIVRYSVEYRATGATDWTEVRRAWALGTDTTLSYTIENLTNGSPYEVRVLAASSSTSTVHANDAYWVGGLVGTNGGPYAKGSGRIIACYARNAVNGKGDVGGLVGENYASISTSYSTGGVHKHGGPYAGPMGGLIGRNELNNNDSTVYYRVTDSYWDSNLTNWPFGVGSDDDNRNNVVDSDETNTLPGHTTAQLQVPTGYSGIYANWDVDVDGANTVDNPWDFGRSDEYPDLR